MKQILYSLSFLVLFALNTVAQNSTVLNINEATLAINGIKKEGNTGDIILKSNGQSPFFDIYNKDNTVITASFDLRGYHAGRSSHKATGIKMKVQYKALHNGKRVSKKVEHMFFINDSGEFIAKQPFYFKTGIRSEMLVLSYKGTIQK